MGYIVLWVRFIGFFSCVSGSMLYEALYKAFVLASAAGASFFVAIKTINYLFPWFKYDLKYMKAIVSIVMQIKRYGKRRPIYTMVDR